jgi:hypothetical protein
VLVALEVQLQTQLVSSGPDV